MVSLVAVDTGTVNVKTPPVRASLNVVVVPPLEAMMTSVQAALFSVESNWHWKLSDKVAPFVDATATADRCVESSTSVTVRRSW